VLNVVDLFCGAGGFSQGFKDAGFNILLGIDYEKHKLEVYRRNICKNILHIDVTTLHGYDISNRVQNQKIDILIGSPPCKSFSTCNPKKHEDIFFMDKSSLSIHFLRLTSILSPLWFIMENVPQYYSTLDGEFITHLFRVLGYNICFLDIDAANLGVPQHRKRCFLIGNRVGVDSELQIHSKTTVSIRDAISDLENHNIDINNIKEIIQLEEPLSQYQKTMRNKDNKVRNHIPTIHKQKTIDILNTLKEGQTYKQKRNYKRPYYDFPADTITTRFEIPSGQGCSIHPKINRSFTPREAARLQSFKDSFEFFGKSIEEIRDQIGDAVPPLVAYEIALQVRKVMECKAHT
jgi:DNA (cytosine-5)-methyltransferase 1